MPPVSSRTTSRSVPSMRSRRSGLASSSAPLGRTGLRLANSSSPFRSASRPCSGRGAPGAVVPHFGPPTAPRSTASESRQAARSSGVRAVPCASIEAPPTRCSSTSKPPIASSSSRAAAMISGPMPSPGRVTMRWGVLGIGVYSSDEGWLMRRLLSQASCLVRPVAPLGRTLRRSATAGHDVQADVVELRIRALGHALDEAGAQVLGQSLEVVPEADGSHVLAGLRRRDRPWLEPRLDLLEARPLEALRGLLGARVVPGTAPPPYVLVVGRLRGDLPHHVVKALDIAPSAALRRQRCA